MGLNTIMTIEVEKVVKADDKSCEMRIFNWQYLAIHNNSVIVSTRVTKDRNCLSITNDSLVIQADSQSYFRMF